MTQDNKAVADRIEFKEAVEAFNRFEFEYAIEGLINDNEKNGWLHGYKYAEERIKTLEAENAELRAAQFIPRALEWQEPCRANNYCHIAETKIGDYYVHVDGGAHHAAFEINGLDIIDDDTRLGKQSGSLYKEKMKCQEHYNEFARSLFDVTPVKEQS